jgi:PAS domain S-box-containing protein
MLVTIHCVHCGKSLAVPEELGGKRVRCVECRGVFRAPNLAALRPGPLQPPSDVPGPGPGPGPAPAGAPAREAIVSRSMLMPIPGMAAAASGEWICRLEPGTLRWLELSPGLAEFLGRTIDPLEPRTLFEDLHPDDCVLAEDEFRQVAEHGERHGIVLRIRGRSAEWHYVTIHPQARYESSGRINHIRCNLKDVTDRVHAEQELRRRTEQLTAANEQLREANRKLAETQGQLIHSEKLAALGTLAAGMAHEINNPLAYALNNVTVLGRDLGQVFRLVARYEECLGALEPKALDPERVESVARFRADIDFDYLLESLPRLAEAAGMGLRRVAQIVQNLRDFAQLDRAAIGEVDINESIEQSLGMLAENLARQRVTVARDLQPLPPLEGAAAQLNQLFLNLLLNALQAIEETGRPSGRIEVATRPTEGHIVVEIADDGCGIPAELRARIFDPFFTTKPVGSGTGLGLSLSLGIVSDHGGRIEVESTPGAGSRFRVVLPVRCAS